MKRSLAIFACIGMSVLTSVGQASRPRVVPTPTPSVPVIQNDTQRRDDLGAPVLRGSDRRPQPSATATPPAAGDDEVIRVETNLVTMPVSVLDRDGRFVSGLRQQDFRIFENGVEHRVEYFQSVEQPFTVVLMIDVSPSTQYQIHEIQSAAIAFTEQLRPNDKVMVIAFDETVQILTYPTNDRYRLRGAIQMANFGNGTSLYEAIDQVLNRELSRIEGRKAVVLFTDGVDTTSRHASFEQTLRDVEETDVLIYPIRYNTQRDYGRGYGGYGGGSRRRGGGSWGDVLGAILGGGFPNVRVGGGGAGSSPQEYERGRQYLESLATNSGGRSFEADTLVNLDAAFSGIAEELRRQYSLGYYPENPGQRGERRQIRIRVMRPDVVVRAKNHYVYGGNNGN